MGFSTTMSGLLTSVKARFLEYQNTTLADVNTYKRGILPPIPLFPALVLLPYTEVIGRYVAPNKYYVTKSIFVELYEKSLSSSSSLRETTKLADVVRDILYADRQFKDSGGTPICYDSVITLESYGEEVPYKNQMLQKTSFLVEFTMKEDLPSALGTDTDDIVSTDVNDLTDTIYSAIYAERSSSLSNVKTYKKDVIEPVMTFPAVCVLANAGEADHTWAGFDTVAKTFEIIVLDKMLDKEALLNRVLGITEDIKDILQQHYKLDGKALNSSIGTITYGVYHDQKDNALYATSVLYDVTYRKSTD